MGAAQNSINQAIGVGLGLAGTGAHLANQQESIKEQEATKKLAGLNAASVAQSQLNDVNVQFDEAAQNWGQKATEAGQAVTKLTDERKKAGNTTVDKGGHVRSIKDNGKMGPIYSLKSLEKAYTAAESAEAARVGAIQNIQRVLAQRQAILAKSKSINEIYGSDIVDIPGLYGEKAEKLIKEYNLINEDSLKPTKLSKEPIRPGGKK